MWGVEHYYIQHKIGKKMTTLNQIKYKLISFFENHKQINQVVYSDKFDFAAIRNLTYPAVNIIYTSASVNGKMLSHGFNVLILDLIQPDNSVSEDEIISDTLLMAEDFYAWLWTVPDFVFSRKSSIDLVSDDNGDRVSGVSFLINLDVVRSDNVCIAPLDVIENPVETFIAYWGWVDSVEEVNSLETIQALQGNKTLPINSNVSADYRQNSVPKYLIMAEPITEPVKTKWYGSTLNQGTIGVNEDDLFGTPSTVDGMRVYSTAYKTQQTETTINFIKD